MDWNEILEFIIQHWDSISALIVAILSMLGATKWGSSQSQAIDLLTKAIEESDVRLDDAGKVKITVSKKRAGLKGKLIDKMIERSINKAREEYEKGKK